MRTRKEWQIQEFQTGVLSTNQKGDDILGDQGNSGHAEAETGHWPNPRSEIRFPVLLHAHIIQGQITKINFNDSCFCFIFRSLGPLTWYLKLGYAWYLSNL